jgi:hypothetical protein
MLFTRDLAGFQQVPMQVHFDALLRGCIERCVGLSMH